MHCAQKKKRRRKKKVPQAKEKEEKGRQGEKTYLSPKLKAEEKLPEV